MRFANGIFKHVTLASAAATTVVPELTATKAFRRITSFFSDSNSSLTLWQRRTHLFNTVTPLLTPNVKLCLIMTSMLFQEALFSTERVNK